MTAAEERSALEAVEAAARIVTFLSDMAGRTQREGPFDYAFDIPHTTIHTGVIHGGSALNIVPSDNIGLLFCQGCFAEMGVDIPTAIRHFGKQNKIL